MRTSTIELKNRLIELGREISTAPRDYIGSRELMEIRSKLARLPDNERHELLEGVEPVVIKIISER